MVSTLLGLIDIIFTLYSVAIIARSFLPFLRVDPYHPAVQFLIKITEPFLAPIRRTIPTIQGLDFSPMVALLILWLIQMVIERLLQLFLYVG
jgi:YggT family protein